MRNFNFERRNASVCCYSSWRKTIFGERRRYSGSSFFGPKPQSFVTVKEVLLVAEGKKIDVGQPLLKGASVVCDVVENTLGTKIFPFKFKRRKGYKRKIGHRQKYTLLKVKEIKVG